MAKEIAQDKDLVKGRRRPFDSANTTCIDSIDGPLPGQRVGRFLDLDLDSLTNEDPSEGSVIVIDNRERNGPLGDWLYLSSHDCLATFWNPPCDFSSQETRRNSIGDMYVFHRNPVENERTVVIHPSRSSLEGRAVPGRAHLSRENSIVPPFGHLELAQFDEDWNGLNLLRNHVQGIRDDVHAQKLILDDFQTAKEKADDEYISLIRSKHLGLSNPDKNASNMEEVESNWEQELEKRWEHCQKARNDCGPADFTLRTLEDKLMATETRFESLQGEVYHQWREMHTRTPQPSHSYLNTTGNPRRSLNNKNKEAEQDGASSSSSDFQPKEYPPLHEEYLERLGDLDLLQESYDELRLRKRILEDDIELTDGEYLESEDIDFLQNYEKLELELLAEMRSVEIDVDALKRRCEEANLIDSDGNTILEDDRQLIEQTKEAEFKEVEIETQRASSLDLYEPEQSVDQVNHTVSQTSAAETEKSWYSGRTWFVV